MNEKKLEELREELRAVAEFRFSRLSVQTIAKVLLVLEHRITELEKDMSALWEKRLDARITSLETADE